MNNQYKNTILARADSYKYSHWLQYPPGITNNNSYIESRGISKNSIIPQNSQMVFFGLQMFIKKYLQTPITLEMINMVEEMCVAHGEPFNRTGWIDIEKKFGGMLPLIIEAVPEGTVLNPKNVLVQVKATHDDFAWLASFVETAMLRSVWYPSTVATLSRAIKLNMYKNLVKSSDNIDDVLAFKLHDFGARGVSSGESAEIGGLAHLLNFHGTDTFESLFAAKEYYNELQPVGYSIPASEHSTMTMWGRENENKAMENMIDTYGGTGKLFACVSDSYNYGNAVENIWGGELKDKVMNNGGRLVIRPDSGDPVKTPVWTIEELSERFGFTVNNKGYKVLPDYIRVIQGDGVDINTIEQTEKMLIDRGYSSENIAFGSGGALLQKLNRDDLQFAQKTNAACDENGDWFDVYKDPIGMPSKKSKAGVLSLIKDNQGTFHTVKRISNKVNPEEQLKVVWNSGRLLVDENFTNIRSRTW